MIRPVESTPGSGKNESLRDTDTWISGGIQLPGAPLLIPFFPLGLMSWLRGRPAPPPEPAVPAAAGE